MSRVRSPAYPSISLPDAVDRIKKIHKSQQHLPEPREVVAKHMGYSSLNGSALKALSALIKYDLLSPVSEGDLKVSDVAISIIFAETEAEKGKAILECATAPSLFKEIYERWEGEIPSDESLTSFLARRQFSTSAMSSVIKNYKETFALVASESVPYDSSDDDLDVEDEVLTLEKPKPTAAPKAVAGMNIGFLGTSIQMAGTITSKEDAQKAIDAITALKALLPDD